MSRLEDLFERDGEPSVKDFVNSLDSKHQSRLMTASIESDFIRFCSLQDIEDLTPEQLVNVIDFLSVAGHHSDDRELIDKFRRWFPGI